MNTAPDISIAIINYNGASYIEACLDSVLNHQCDSTFEVIVVDNDSKDNSASILKTYEDRVRVIYNDRNQGFSWANNQAFKDATGEFVFLLNNDTLMHDGVLDTLKDYLVKHPYVGVVSPKLLNEDGSLQNHGSSLNARHYRGSVPKKVPFVIGAAIMMRKDLYDQIGGLDEAYFFYNDDIDLCKTLHRMGYQVHYNPTVSVTHFVGLATKTRSIPSIIEGYRGSTYFVRKFYPYPIYLLYRLLMIAILILQSLVYLPVSVYSSTARSTVSAYLKVIAILCTGNIEAIRT